MKYTTTQTKTIDYEIESFPAFVRFGGVYYKIVSEQELIKVEDWGFQDKGISVKSINRCSPFANEGWEFITEQEFDVVFESVLNYLNSFSKQTFLTCD